MTKTIFHITSQTAWQTALEQDYYSSSSLETEGFIHCSTQEQILPVANHHYRGVQDLILLEINPQKLTAELKFEGLHTGVGQDFPHVYGTIPVAAVEQVYPFPCLENGLFNLPEL